MSELQGKGSIEDMMAETFHMIAHLFELMADEMKHTGKKLKDNITDASKNNSPAETSEAGFKEHLQSASEKILRVLTGIHENPCDKGSSTLTPLPSIFNISVNSSRQSVEKPETEFAETKQQEADNDAEVEEITSSIAAECIQDAERSTVYSGDGVGVEDSDNDVDGGTTLEEGAGDFPTLIEVTGSEETCGGIRECLNVEDDGDDAAVENETQEGGSQCNEGSINEAADNVIEEEGRDVVEENTNACESNTDQTDTAEEDDGTGRSDLESDSLVTTEDEEYTSQNIRLEDDSTEVFGRSAAHVFRRHLEQNGVQIELVRSNREQSGKHNTYACTVLGIQAEARGKSKRAARRNALSKIIRLIVKKQEEGTLPEEISPFSAEELSTLSEARRDSSDYVGRLQRLCRSLGAEPPVYNVEAERGQPGEVLFTVHCSALGATATGVSRKMRSAKRRAAKVIINTHEKKPAETAA